MGRDEADLVMAAPDGVTLVIVEVKTRRKPDPPPEAAVDHRKLFRLRRASAKVLRTAPRALSEVRVDIVAIVWPEKGRVVIRHTTGL